MVENNYKLLLHGIDSLYCAYYLEHSGEASIDFQKLTEQKENLRQSKSKDPAVVQLGNSEFFLYPYGTASGYPLVLSNEDFKIELGEYNIPNFYVTFKSQALWRESAFSLHEKFLSWAGSAGYSPFRSESLSRLDYCFDYNLPAIEFTEDSFISRSNKDSKHREDSKPQTFTFGKGDVVLRVYDKIAEIKQQSDKVWFYLLWGQDKDVWRIEWQVRKPILKMFDIRTFEDLKNQLGDLLRYLANEHDTLRVPSDDSNPSRWPSRCSLFNIILSLSRSSLSSSTFLLPLGIILKGFVFPSSLTEVTTVECQMGLYWVSVGLGDRISKFFASSGKI